MGQQPEGSGEQWEAAAALQCLATPKRIRGLCAGEVVVDSRRAVLLREQGRPPVYYFPQDDVRMDLLKRSPRGGRCQRKGEYQLWDLRVDRCAVSDAAWVIGRPTAPAQPLADWIAFDWAALDAWFEEDEQVHTHPRDPFTRIDILASSREVRVTVAGEAVAESRRPVLLLETGQRPRYYLPLLDVWADRLLASDHVSWCPYKGEAHYYHVQVRGRVHENLVWYYRYPTPEAQRIANLLCFYDERVDGFFVDGVKQKAAGVSPVAAKLRR